jgi:hypothetical protein
LIGGNIESYKYEGEERIPDLLSALALISVV